jgi:hypothetical protein
VVDIIKMDLLKIGWGGVGWVGVAQDRDQWEGSCELGNGPSGYIKFWEVVEYLHNWLPLEQGPDQRSPNSRKMLTK